MRFFARRRVGAWTAGLERWASERQAEEPDVEAKSYFVGVVMAVMASAGEGPALSQTEVTKRFRDNAKRTETTGYVAAKLLIHNVHGLGDAPAADYAALLSAPHLELSRH